MAARLIIAPGAESDLVEAFTWYEDRRAGLDDDFLSSLDACVESIRPHPW